MLEKLLEIVSYIYIWEHVAPYVWIGIMVLILIGLGIAAVITDRYEKWNNDRDGKE